MAPTSAAKLPTWQKAQPTPWQAFWRDPATVVARWLYSKRKQHVLSAPQAQAGLSRIQPLSIVCISDTHNAQPQVPDGDVLLHTGDLTNGGSFAEIQAQLAWLQSLPHRHKVVIGGNHDLLLDSTFAERHPDRIPDDSCGDGTSLADLEWGDLIYLNDRSVTLELPVPAPASPASPASPSSFSHTITPEARTLLIYGAPWTEQCGVFAFQYPPVRERVWADRIPDNTDIVMVHGPPKGYCDMGGKGCPQLLREIRRAQPALAVFGHIHGGYGQEDMIHSHVEAAYSAIELGDRGLLGVAALLGWLLWDTLFGWLPPHKKVKRTRLVNAALMIGLGADGRPDLRAPVVVQL
ncbi:phosphoesterase [Ophiostoma piceae UAMH 11346]|uniref:Phosphoesterase n=1 Tax=Ophiostoma piceae (strain UAMH 11346) TaxID=1262450 RepID=S3CBI5_OPHP1|nr:phosphoesterase [Ophiostoma piceae UAMH 11346]